MLNYGATMDPDAQPSRPRRSHEKLLSHLQANSVQNDTLGRFQRELARMFGQNKHVPALEEMLGRKLSWTLADAVPFYEIVTRQLSLPAGLDTGDIDAGADILKSISWYGTLLSQILYVRELTWLSAKWSQAAFQFIQDGIERDQVAMKNLQGRMGVLAANAIRQGFRGIADDEALDRAITIMMQPTSDRVANYTRTGYSATAATQRSASASNAETCDKVLTGPLAPIRAWFNDTLGISIDPAVAAGTAPPKNSIREAVEKISGAGLVLSVHSAKLAGKVLRFRVANDDAADVANEGGALRTLLLQELREKGTLDLVYTDDV
jgi:hypothetical protein